MESLDRKLLIDELVNHANEEDKLLRDYEAEIDKVEKNPNISQSFMTQRKREIEAQYAEDKAERAEKIHKTIEKFKENASRPFTPNEDILAKLDFIITMNQSNALDLDHIEKLCVENAGEESALLYIRQKLKNANIQPSIVEKYLFSSFDVSVDGNTFTPANVYLDLLETSMNAESQFTRRTAINKTAEILVAEDSADLQKYNQNIQAIEDKHNGIL